jgi:cell division septum initiation protein DivIVA
MSELATAREQLEQAIARLETALATRGDSADLERALAEARAETQNLRRVADTVSGRLDAAIGRLKTTLETGT